MQCHDQTHGSKRPSSSPIQEKSVFRNLRRSASGSTACMETNPMKWANTSGLQPILTNTLGSSVSEFSRRTPTQTLCQHLKFFLLRKTQLNNPPRARPRLQLQHLRQPSLCPNSTKNKTSKTCWKLLQNKSSLSQNAKPTATKTSHESLTNLASKEVLQT